MTQTDFRKTHPDQFYEQGTHEILWESFLENCLAHDRNFLMTGKMS